MSVPLIPPDMGMSLQNGKLLSPILPEHHQHQHQQQHQQQPHHHHHQQQHQQHQLKSDYCHDMIPRYTDMSLTRLSPPPAQQATPTGYSLPPPPPPHMTQNCNPVESMLEQITGVNIPSLPGNASVMAEGGQMFPCGPPGLYPVCPPLGPPSLAPHLSSSISSGPPLHVGGLQLTPNGSLHHAHNPAHMLAAPGGMVGVGGAVGLMSRPQLLEPQQADIECDPRELEAFAEHFKQRRIKLSVTQVTIAIVPGIARDSTL